MNEPPIVQKQRRRVLHMSPLPESGVALSVPERIIQMQWVV